MEDRELLLKSDPEFERLAFTVLAIWQYRRIGTTVAHESVPS